MSAPKYYPAPQSPANIPYQEVYDTLFGPIKTMLDYIYIKSYELVNTLCTPAHGYLAEPLRPLSISDETTWDAYRTEVATYYDTLNTTRQGIQDAIVNVNVALQALFAMIPPNTWITFSADTISPWTVTDGMLDPPIYIGWHTCDVDLAYKPTLLLLDQHYAVPDVPLQDGINDPAHAHKHSVDAVLAKVANFDAAVFARILAGDYSGG